MPTAAEIKKALREAGIEVYRTLGDVVYLADRPRENLLMETGVSVRSVAPLGTAVRVGFVVRAQRSDFPHDGEDQLFARASGLAAAAVPRGYREAAREARKLVDAGDSERVDTSCEVAYEIDVEDLDAAIVEARFALALEKVAAPSRSS